MKYEIRQNKEENRFEALDENKVIGFVTYFLRNGNQVVVPHTEVKKEYEGQGIAAELTRNLLNFIRENGHTVKPLCPYTKSYIERHSEYQDLVR